MDNISVDNVYDGLSEGERCHLFNKLAKHGYDHRNGHTVAVSLSPKQLREVKEFLAIPEKTYSLGHRVSTSKGHYILAYKHNNTVGVLEIQSGRWWEFMRVNDSAKITQSEFDQLTEGL